MTSPLDLDPRSLVVLHLVVRHGSLSGAARELGWTHPAVSQHVRRLERAAGCTLLERHGRGVRPTQAGALLARHAAEVAAALRGADDCLSGLASDRPARLRVAAFPTACATIVLEAVRALALDTPALAVDVLQAEPPEATRALREGAADLAVVFDDVLPGAPGLLARPAGRDPLLIVLPENHPLAGQAQVPLAALEDATVLAGCPTCRARWERHCARSGVRTRLHHQVTDDHVLMQAMVAAGQGAAVLPGLALSAHRRPDVVALPLDPPLGRDLAVLVRGDTPVAGPVAAFAEHLTASAGR
ncbi:LysR family transcriptional regulator [Kineococcus sp. T13]|uniref:LysR family transcriptional regulator n=1 Tax=Kineococcus vitellinus TaxID=2696565 RepID=UPI00141245A2|nr:LysR family transcriptional regulator [Kineococcus vitellinus]NAZ75489.1 LysR family transcriptional regulator [Kineococcus vitellinus]